MSFQFKAFGIYLECLFMIWLCTGRVRKRMRKTDQLVSIISQGQFVYNSLSMQAHFYHSRYSWLVECFIFRRRIIHAVGNTRLVKNIEILLSMWREKPKQSTVYLLFLNEHRNNCWKVINANKSFDNNIIRKNFYPKLNF